MALSVVRGIVLMHLPSQFCVQEEKKITKRKKEEEENPILLVLGFGFILSTHSMHLWSFVKVCILFGSNNPTKIFKIVQSLLLYAITMWSHRSRQLTYSFIGFSFLVFSIKWIIDAFMNISASINIIYKSMKKKHTLRNEYWDRQ